MLMIRMKG